MPSIAEHFDHHRRCGEAEVDTDQRVAPVKAPECRGALRSRSGRDRPRCAPRDRDARRCARGTRPAERAASDRSRRVSAGPPTCGQRRRRGGRCRRSIGAMVRGGRTGSRSRPGFGTRCRADLSQPPNGGWFWPCRRANRGRDSPPTPSLPLASIELTTHPGIVQLPSLPHTRPAPTSRPSGDSVSPHRRCVALCGGADGGRDGGETGGETGARGARGARDRGRGPRVRPGRAPR